MSARREMNCSFSFGKASVSVDEVVPGLTPTQLDGLISALAGGVCLALRPAANKLYEEYCQADAKEGSSAGSLDRTIGCSHGTINIKVKLRLNVAGVPTAKIAGILTELNNIDKLVDEYHREVHGQGDGSLLGALKDVFEDVVMPQRDPIARGGFDPTPYAAKLLGGLGLDDLLAGRSRFGADHPDRFPGA